MPEQYRPEGKKSCQNYDKTCRNLLNKNGPVMCDTKISNSTTPSKVLVELTRASPFLIGMFVFNDSYYGNPKVDDETLFEQVLKRIMARNLHQKKNLL